MQCLLRAALLISTAVAYADESFENLAQQVEIRRTEYGVPHILAQNEEAASFGFAWAQCEDHFPLVYKAMVRGRGEMSRHYGASADNIRFDTQMRQLRARQHVIEAYHAYPHEYRKSMEGFASGINAYMQTHPDDVEGWMTPVSGHDVAAAWEIAVMRFTFLRGDVIGRFKKGIEASRRSQGLAPAPRDYSEGSNAIALAPSRTISGNSILLNNPHQPWIEAAWYYEAHITVPGKVNFYGSTFVGAHLLTTGFNDALGWAHTTNYPDLAELYEVALDPERENHYLFDGGSVPIEHRVVTIELDDGESISQDMYWSPLGPVIQIEDDRAYILRAAGYKQTFSGLQWFRMARAKSFDEFKEVLTIHAIPMFNITYADREGNIFYIWNGTMPDMPHERNDYEPVPASSTDDIWSTFHGLDELMQFENPTGGYVQNCNSPPYMTNLHEPLNRGDYPAHYPKNDLSLRTQHGLAIIHNDRRFSLEEIIAEKHRMDMWLAHRVKDDLLQILAEADLNEQETEAAKMLDRWDNTASIDSVGSVLFDTWWNLYRRGDAVYTQEWAEAAPMSTPDGLGHPERAVEMFKSAVAETTERWGSWDVRWGEVHRVRRGKHDYPLGGGSWRLGCLRVCLYSDAEDGKRVMNSGDGFILAVEFADEPRAYSVLAYGQSGRVDSDHYDDQISLFSKHQMKPVAFSEAAIKQSLLRSYHPALR